MRSSRLYIRFTVGMLLAMMFVAAIPQVVSAACRWGSYRTVTATNSVQQYTKYTSTVTFKYGYPCDNSSYGAPTSIYVSSAKYTWSISQGSGSSGTGYHWVPQISLGKGNPDEYVAYWGPGFKLDGYSSCRNACTMSYTANPQREIPYAGNPSFRVRCFNCNLLGTNFIYEYLHYLVPNRVDMWIDSL